jgi:hypothetical protein
VEHEKMKMKTLAKSLVVLVILMAIILAISFAWVWTDNPHDQVTLGLIFEFAANIVAWVIRIGVILVIIYICLELL